MAGVSGRKLIAFTFRLVTIGMKSTKRSDVTCALLLSTGRTTLMPEYPYHDAYVRKLSLFRYQGQCRCRWQGPIRLTHAKAASDCLQHEL
jgi:hypothetical protein